MASSYLFPLLFLELYFLGFSFPSSMQCREPSKGCSRNEIVSPSFCIFPVHYSSFSVSLAFLRPTFFGFHSSFGFLLTNAGFLPLEFSSFKDFPDLSYLFICCKDLVQEKTFLRSFLP